MRWKIPVYPTLLPLVGLLWLATSLLPEPEAEQAPPPRHACRAGCTAHDLVASTD